MISIDSEITMDEIRGLIFELAVSTLRIFNKCCKRIVYGSTYEILTKEESAMPTFVESQVLIWQRDIKEYSYVALELCKYYTQIRVFPNDSMLGMREVFFPRYNGISYSEESITNEHRMHTE